MNTEDKLVSDGETNPSNELARANVAAFAHVNLPKFWRHSPRIWFTHAEAVFATQRVTADSTRINHVLAALDEDGIRAVYDLVGPNASYNALRQRLIDAFDVPRAARFRTFVQPGGMGDRRPSQLLRDMRSMLPEGIDETALREFWLQKLPTNVRTVIASLDCPLEALAIRADRVMEAYDNQAVEVVNREDDRLENLERVVITLTRQIQALITATGSQPRGQASAAAPPRRRSPQPPRDRSPPTVLARDNCYYHQRYGPTARNCRKPCAFFDNLGVAPDPTLQAKRPAEN